MKRGLKAVSALILGTSCVCSVLPVYAEDNEITKSEDVYAVLNSDGSVDEIVVTEHLHSDNGFAGYEDVSSLQNVENLKSEEEPETDAQGYIWNSDSTDIYYQGSTEEELPLGVDITYELDGQEYDEKDLPGKSGHVKYTIHLTNRLRRNYEVNGHTYDIAVPLFTAAGGMFDLDHFSNISVSHGSIESDSSHDIVFGVLLPGLKDSLSQVIDDEMMDTLSAYLNDEIVIEADVSDYVSPTLMLAGAGTMDALKSELTEYDLTSVFDQLDELQAATDQLVTGTQSLYEGAVSLQDGIDTAAEGSQQLAEGTAELSQGAEKIADGAEQVYAGSTALTAGLETLNANNSTLNAGAASLSDGVFTLVNTVLASQSLPTVTPENYASVFAGQFDVTSEQIETARAQIASQTAAVNGSALSEDDLAKLLYYAAVTGDQSFSSENLMNAAETLQQAKTAAMQVSDAAARAGNGINDTAAAELVSAMHAYLSENPGEEQIQQAYESILSSLMSSQLITSQLHAYGITDEAQIRNVCEQVLTYAVDHHGAAGLTDSGNLAEGLQAFAQAYASGSTLTDVTGLDDVNVKAVCTAAASNAIRAYADEDVYASLISSMVQNGIDQSTAALVIAYGASYVTYENTSPSAYLTGVAVTLTNLQNLNHTLETNYDTEQTKQLVDSKLADAYINAYTGNEDLKNMKQLLDGMLALKSGIAAYTAGAASALDGAGQLSQGAQELSQGSETLAAGAEEVNAGSTALNRGMSQLSEGASRLTEGADTLLEGMKRYNTEAIQKLTKNDKISTIQQAADLFDTIRLDEYAYDNYAGISEGTQGSVKFIFKVNSTKADTKVQSEETQETQDQRTFWQRVKDLF